MARSDIEIVLATPEHSSFLAEAIHASSRSQLDTGPFDIALGLPSAEVRDILEWMTLSEIISSCHYSNFLVAQIDSKAVGALAAFDPGHVDVLPVGAALSEAYSCMGYHEAELVVALQRLDVMRECLPLAPPGIWVVEWVAVDPAHRGRGIATKLLENVLSSGADRSYTKSQISTYLGNDTAIRAYQRVGFRVHREYRDPKFESLLGPPGMVMMMRDLPQFRSGSEAAASSKP